MKYLLTAVVLAGGLSAGEVPAKRVIDKQFVFVTGISLAGAALDIHSTRSCFAASPRCYEGVGLFTGGRPSTAQLTAVNAPMQAGVNGLGYLLKRKGKSWWWMPQVTFAAIKIGFAVKNYRNASDLRNGRI